MQTPATYSETEVIGLLKARDEKIFAYLYEHYGAGLYNIILQIIPDRELANDLLQETFINIWNNAEGYDYTKGRLFTWMLRIARNVSIDMLRSKRYRNSLNTVAASAYDEDNVYGNIAQAEADALRNNGLGKAIGQLKQQHRELIELVYFQGYTQAEIAAIQSVPLGTIKTRIRSALVQLKKYLK